MSDNNKKLVNLSSLEILAKGLDQRAAEKIQELATKLESEIQVVDEKFGGKKFVFLTTAEYNVLSDAQKNDSSIVYNIIDAVDTSHEHENKDYLDGIENTIQSLDSKITSKADSDHKHDDLYCTVSKMQDVEAAIEELGDALEQQATDTSGAIQEATSAVTTTILNDMLGGKKLVYLTEADYNALTEEQKNDEGIIYNITDAESADHEHENLEFLNKLQPVTFKIGNAIRELNYDNAAIEISLEDIGVNGEGHDHDGRYYTETEVDGLLAQKSNEGHNHHGDYYQKSEIESKIGTINTALAGKSDDDHTHPELGIDNINSSIENMGDEIEVISGQMVTINNNITALSTSKSDTTHKHDDLYVKSADVENAVNIEKDRAMGVESALQTAIDSKAPAVHTHENLYYDKTTVDNKIGAVSDEVGSNKTALEGQIAASASTTLTSAQQYADNAITALVDSAPEAMNTLNELAKAINNNKGVYDAYIEEHAAAMTALEAAIKKYADDKDSALHTTISAEIDADVKAEKDRAELAESGLQSAIDGKSPIGHNHNDLYYTITNATNLKAELQKEIDDDVKAEADLRLAADNELQTAINGKANSSHGNHVPEVEAANNAKFLRNDNSWATVTPANIGAAEAEHGNHVPAFGAVNNATFLRNDGAWYKVTPADIGASASGHNHNDIYYTESEINTKLEAISTTVDSNHATAMAEAAKKAEKDHVHDMADISETFADISPVAGKLVLTTDRIQYATDVTVQTEIVFPAVSLYTELHVFFESTENMSLVLPDNCKWRVGANLDTGSSYELIAKYNPKTGIWLVNILVYS